MEPTDQRQWLVRSSMVRPLLTHSAGSRACPRAPENDAHAFFHALRGHIVTGPTGTNVNDLYLLLAL